MLKLYHSNDLEVLKGLLLSIMSQQPPGPFEREAILVQSQGMAHWLKLNIADSLGGAAQLDFPLPSSFVWQVFNRLRPDLPERSHFDKQLMSWKLVRLLPELAARPGCEPIAHYLEDDASGIKCWQLSQTIADVFDQYLVYRPDWLLAWEQGENRVQDADVSIHSWQPDVWRALVSDSEKQGHSLMHRARLLEQLPRLVRDHPERLNELPKRLFVFGIAALPGSYWAVLDAISAQVDVHFFLLNPCRNFWGDIVDDRRRLRVLQHQPEAAEYLDRGNPLLASWGKLGRDFLTLVNDSDLELDLEAWVDPDGESMSLLKHLQHDILELNDRQQSAFGVEALEHSRFKQTVPSDDDSIRLISAHSALREVQHLHDQLLSWLDQSAAEGETAGKTTLEPRDIVVMVPDIDQYAPYIDAVFSSASVTIPWAIADQSLARENPVAESFIGLLGLPDSRLVITEVLDWLEVTSVRARFGLSESELDELKDWLTRARVRWGMNGEQRARLGLPAFEQNSWRQGLRQLVLGLMLPDDANDWMGDWPVAAVEGTQAELLGKLLAFVDALEYWQTLLGELRSAQAWLELLPQLIDAFYVSSDQSAQAVAAQADQESLQQQQGAVQRLRDAVVQLGEDLTQSGMMASSEPLSIRVMMAWFSDVLNQQGGWQRFLAGPVNFCTLMPMRSIPFRVVCLLGMNDSDYPRVVPPVGFDLMVSGKPRRGDRSRREDDRYLFLEAVCSAQDKLYISYRGRGVRENNELQPSVLVSELVDYLADGFCLDGDVDLPHSQSRIGFLNWLTESLPLQPFSPKVFENPAESNPDPRAVSSYHALWAHVASAPTISQSPASVTSFLTPESLPLPEALIENPLINWRDVKAAVRNSAGFFMQRRLQAGLRLDWQDSETEEPFVVAGLDAYLLKELQLERLLDATVESPPAIDQLLDTFVRQHQSLGDLPVNALGRVQAQRLNQAIIPLLEALQPYAGQDHVSVSLSLSTSSEQIPARPLVVEGEVNGIVGDVLVQHRVGDLRGQHLVGVWLDLAFATAANPSAVEGEDHALLQGAWIYGVSKKGELETWLMRAPEPELAMDIVQHAVSFCLRSWCQPSPLLPDLLFKLVLSEPEKHAATVEKALAAEFGELADEALLRCLPTIRETLLNEASLQAWQSDYHWLFGPLVAHLGEADNRHQTGRES